MSGPAAEGPVLAGPSRFLPDEAESLCAAVVAAGRRAVGTIAAAVDLVHREARETVTAHGTAIPVAATPSPTRPSPPPTTPPSGIRKRWKGCASAGPGSTAGPTPPTRPARTPARNRPASTSTGENKSPPSCGPGPLHRAGYRSPNHWPASSATTPTPPTGLTAGGISPISGSLPRAPDHPGGRTAMSCCWLTRSTTASLTTRTDRDDRSHHRCYRSDRIARHAARSARSERTREPGVTEGHSARQAPANFTDRNSGWFKPD